MAADVCDLGDGELPDRLRSALAYWKQIKGDRLIPYRRDFDPAAVPKLLPHIILTEVVRREVDLAFQDFRFRLIGTYVDDRMKERYSGRKLSEIANKGPGSDIWGVYCLVKREKKPKLARMNYIGPTDNIKSTRELFLPFSNDGERVDFVIVVLVFE